MQAVVDDVHVHFGRIDARDGQAGFRGECAAFASSASVTIPIASEPVIVSDPDRGLVSGRRPGSRRTPTSASLTGRSSTR